VRADGTSAAANVALARRSWRACAHFLQLSGASSSCCSPQARRRTLRTLRRASGRRSARRAAGREERLGSRQQQTSHAAPNVASCPISPAACSWSCSRWCLGGRETGPLGVGAVDQQGASAFPASAPRPGQVTCSLPADALPRSRRSAVDRPGIEGGSALRAGGRPVGRMNGHLSLPVRPDREAAHDYMRASQGQAQINALEPDVLSTMEVTKLHAMNHAGTDAGQWVIPAKSRSTARRRGSLSDSRQPQCTPTLTREFLENP
jgi:hypothetical protein